MTAVNESSVRFKLVGNLRDNMFSCKLSIKGQTEAVNMTTLGMNDQSQDFTGLKANHTYIITCTPVGEARTMRETSTCFRTQRTGTSGHVILHTIINNNRLSRYFYTSYILRGQAIERKYSYVHMITLALYFRKCRRS